MARPLYEGYFVFLECLFCALTDNENAESMKKDRIQVEKNVRFMLLLF